MGKITEFKNEVVDYRNISRCKKMITLFNFRMEFSMADDKTLCNVPCTTDLTTFYSMKDTCCGTKHGARAQRILFFASCGVLQTSGQSFLDFY